MAYENKQMQENQPPVPKKEEENNKGASVEPKSGKRMFDMMKPAGEEKQESGTGDNK